MLRVVFYIVVTPYYVSGSVLKFSFRNPDLLSGMFWLAKIRGQLDLEYLLLVMPESEHQNLVIATESAKFQVSLFI